MAKVSFELIACRLTWAVLCLVLSCGAPPTSESQPPDFYQPMTLEETSQALSELLGHHADEPDMPKRPRRSAGFSKQFKNSATFVVGLKTQALGLSFGTTVETSFALSWKENMVLVRHSPHGESPIMKETDGSIRLNWHEDAQIIALCSYKASAKGGISLVGRTSFFGNGLKSREEMEEALSIEQGSKYFVVYPEDSIASLQEKCFTHFKNHVQESVIQDLKNLIQANIFFLHDSAYSNEQKAVECALHGPDSQVFTIKNRKFRIEIAKSFTTLNQHLVVKGRLHEVVKWWPDKQISYFLLYHDGILISSSYSITTIFGSVEDNALSADVRYLAELIGAEAVLQSASASI
jgi:hypothetical protein